MTAFTCLNADNTDLSDNCQTFGPSQSVGGTVDKPKVATVVSY